MSLLRRAASSLMEARGASGSLPWGDSTPPPISALGGSASGVQVNEKTGLQIAAVYGSVSLICDAIATLPVKVLQVREGKPATAIPAPMVIEDPFSECSPIDFRTQGTFSLLMRGNFFGQIISRDKRNPVFPTQVKPIHPDHARVRRNTNGAIEWRYHGEVQKPADVTIIRALTPPESLLGVDPISAMRHTFGNAHAQDLFAGAFFSNSAQPDGIIETEHDLDKEETKRLVSNWKQGHQGIGKAYLPGVLTGGAKWVPVTVTPQNAQFLEQMQYSASLISGMIFRVPPHMIGLVDRSTSWGSGIEQQEQGFVTNTLLGWIRRWEYLLSSWLPPTQIAVLDLSHRLRGDTLQRWAAYQVARVIGAMNILEIRNAEGLPAVEDPSLTPYLTNYAAPLNSSPMPAQPQQGGDKANAANDPHQESRASALLARTAALLNSTAALYESDPQLSTQILDINA